MAQRVLARLVASHSRVVAVAQRMLARLVASHSRVVAVAQRMLARLVASSPIAVQSKGGEACPGSKVAFTSVRELRAPDRI